MNLVATAGFLQKRVHNATRPTVKTQHSLDVFERHGVKEVDQKLIGAGDGAARLIAAWVDENWRCHQLCSTSMTSTSYRLALRMYLRCLGRHYS